MKTCHFVVFTLFLSCTVNCVNAKVKFEFGNLISKDNWNGTVLTNLRLAVEIKCLATFPTQWKFEEDKISRIAFRTEWTQREVKGSVEDKQYTYISLIKVQYSNIIQSPQIFKCEPVNYSDDPEVLVVKFQPIRNDQILLLTNYETYRPEIPKRLTPCDLKLGFMDAGPYGLYVRCTKAQTEEVGVTQVHHCPRSTAYCSNTLRNLKSLKNTCVEKLNDTSDEPVEEDGWTKIRFGTSKTTLIPGIVECSVGELRGAQEYFFTAPKIGDEISNNRGELHFSWNEIQPKDMIWLWVTTIPSVSTNSYYYTEQSQNISGICTVPKYGFAVEPLLIRKLNGSTLSEESNFVNADWEDTWQKYFEVKLDQPGRHEILCMGPVWNSTEWALQTFQCNVRDSIPPYFDDPSPELVSLIEGEDKEVICTANGDPAPVVHWNLPKDVDGVKTNGGTLTFITPTLSNIGSYACNATNLFGQSTTTSKIFLVTVSSQSTNNNATIGLGWLVLLGIGAVFVFICLCTGILYFFKSFLRRYFDLNDSNGKYINVEGGTASYETLSSGTGMSTEMALDFIPYGTTAIRFLRSLIQSSEFDFDCDRFYYDTHELPTTVGGGVKGKVEIQRGTPTDAFIKRADYQSEQKFVKKLLVEFQAYRVISKNYPSTHPFIVNLLRACANTDTKYEQETLLAIDYCEWKMFDFLQNKSIKFDNRVKNGVLTPGLGLRAGLVTNDDNSTTIEFSTFDMIAWGMQIASALEFIGSKGIIHEQFGMRYVYLTTKPTGIDAKIGSFGRTKYVDLEECTKFGSYAFASTQWHVFTLGENLNREVQSDELLLQPRNAPDEIFDMMTKCLKPNVASRPTLTAMIDILNTCYYQVS